MKTMLRLVVSAVLALVLLMRAEALFTCQGGSTAEALVNCPDGGAQKYSSGGRVYARIMYAVNVPNKDYSGPSAKVSDPYVRFTVGGQEHESKVVRNDLTPNWDGDRVDLGVLNSGTQLKVELMDFDIGIEYFYADRTLGRGSLRVPFCSTFDESRAIVREVEECDAPFGCSSDESSWKMPFRQLCQEEGYMDFNPVGDDTNWGRNNRENDHCIAGTGLCMYLRFEIVPFQVEIPRMEMTQMQYEPRVSVASRSALATGSDAAPWTADWGNPFLEVSSDDELDFSPGRTWSGFEGAIIIRQALLDKGFGLPNRVKFYTAINFAADVYVCRYNVDQEVAEPDWLGSYDGSKKLAIKVRTDNNYDYGCYYMYKDGTFRNKWGGVEGKEIRFLTNTVWELTEKVPNSDLYESEVDPNGDMLDYERNYIVMLVPRTGAPVDDNVIIRYSTSVFVASCFTHGLMFLWFTFLANRFLAKLDYRLNRVTSWLAGRVTTGDDQTILAQLFMTFDETPCNVEFRTHLFDASMIMYVMMTLPCWVLFAWGYEYANTGQPVVLGYFIAWVGNAALFMLLALYSWESMNWRMDPTTFALVGVALLAFFVFLVCTVFADPAHVNYGEPIDFTALSLLFATLNCVPLILLVFKQDKTYKNDTNAVFLKMSEAVYDMQEVGGKHVKRANAGVSANKALHALLGDGYTLNPNCHAFKFSTVLTDMKKDGSKKESMREKLAQRGDTNYNMGLLIMFLYFCIAAANTGYPSLAFLHILVLVLFDTIHTALSHGDVVWSPAFKIGLLVAGRVLVMGSPASVWLMSYSVAYTVYAIALVYEVINVMLPMLSKREAGVAAYSGENFGRTNNPDIAGTPTFCFGLLTFSFISLLLVCAYGGHSTLPLGDIDVYGSQWPVYAFGLVAVLLVVSGGLVMATVRAYQLKQLGLLRGWTRTGYFLRPEYDVPFCLVILTEVAILTSGFMIYSSTGSTLILILCIFVPPVVGCFATAYKCWTDNDYDLVNWPPIEKDGEGGDTPSDMEVAFNMIQGLFGTEADKPVALVAAVAEDNEGNPESGSPPATPADGDAGAGGKGGTKDAFALPPLDHKKGSKSDIKMPPLPLKSVLRRKRAGVESNKPAVKEVVAYPGDKSKKDGLGLQGDDGEVLKKDDPWLEFDHEDDVEDATVIKVLDPKEDAAAKAKQELLDKIEALPTERVGFARHPYVLRFTAWLKKSRAGRQLLGVVNKCVKGVSGKYAAISPRGDGEDEGSDSESENEYDQDSDDEDAKKVDDVGPMHENFDRMPFWYAYFFGYLINSEYTAVNSFLGGMLMLMIMGITISENVDPDYMGNLLWVYVWIIITTAVPLYRYFKTYTFDETFWTFVAFDLTFHFLFCLCYFFIALEGDNGLTESLWLLDYFFYFPVVVYCIYEFIKWVDDGYKIEVLDKDGDGDVTWEEYLEYFKAYPIIIAMAFLFNFQLTLWVSETAGTLCLMVLLVSCFSYIFIRDWATNDFFLSPELILVGNWTIQFIVVVCALAGVLGSENPILAVCVLFFAVMFRQGMKLFARYMVADPEEVVYFSPNVLPVYTYDPKVNDLVDESKVAKEFINMLLTGVLWGSFFCVFLYPVSVGIAICSVFLLTVAVSISATMTYVPFKLGQFHTLLTTLNIKESAAAASGKFFERRTPIKLEATHFYGEEADDWDKKPKSALEKMKESNAIVNANDLVEEMRGLTFIRDDSNEGVIDVGEAVVVKVGFIGKWWNKLKDTLSQAFAALPIHFMHGWKKHSHALMDLSDALGVALMSSQGSLGFLGFEGGVKFTLEKMKNEPRLAFLYKGVAWLDDYDSHGNNKKTVQLPEGFDTLTVLARMPDIEHSIDHTFKEESRCAIHFLLLLLVAADAKLQREQVLFQKFLRENRFRLASNGISPPSEVFSSNSFASVDIALVAVWLSTLSEEERERFQMLKSTFSEEQKERDAAIDHEDNMFTLESMELLEERKDRDREMYEKLQRELKSKMDQRIQVFSSRLLPADQLKFETKRVLWRENADITVPDDFADLYQRFREAIMGSDDEATEYARQVLGEIENTQVNCRAGEYGRTYQFSDAEFQTSMGLVTGCTEANKVKEWISAPGISDVTVLFAGGTDPDDVEAGLFKDEWLLSAISMLAAAGGEGEVNDQVINLFVGHRGSGANKSDDMIYSTEVGSYGVRLYKYGVWNPMIIDDIFPVLHEAAWTNENRGMAGAHTKEAAELWVSLIEKAFAKYYGSYVELERGFVHHALSDMTGCESDCLMLAHASRGGGKRALWDKLLRFKRDGYILGAGTAGSALADKEILEMGIIFNAAYTIYDVQFIDGLQLLKLRNPPGDHDEWNGDWSDKSALWTRRLKAKLGWVDEDDNTFWMAFDDFCNVFRHLYVCKWYNPLTWPTKTIPGQWSTNIPYVMDPSIEQDAKSVRSKGLVVQGVDITDGEADSQPKFINTSGGVPTKHNPGCVLENNPHYALHIFRPCEVRITLSQTDSRGSVNGEAMPCAIYVLRNEHPKRPMRVKEISRDALVAYSGEPVDDRTQHLYTTLRPGLYVIVPAIYKAGMSGNYTLSVLSNTRTKLHSFWPPRWMTSGGDAEEDLTDLDASKLFKMGAKMAKSGVEKAGNLGKDIETGGAGRAPIAPR